MRLTKVFHIIIYLVFLSIGLHHCTSKTEKGKESKALKNSISKDSIELKDLESKAKKMAKIENYDSAIYLFFQQINKAQNTHNFYYIGKGYYNLGEIYQYKGDFEKSQDFYEKSIQYLKHSKDSAALIDTYNRMSSLFAELGDFNLAEHFQKESSLYFPKNNKIKLEENLALRFGYFASLQKDYEEALHWFEKVDKNSKIKDNYLIARTNIAFIYVDANKFTEAEKIYKELLTEVDVLTDSAYFAYVTNAYQNLLIRSKNPAVDSVALFNSLKIRQNLHHTIGMMDSYKTITDYHIWQKDTLNAIKSADSLLKMAKKNKSSYYIPIAYKYLINLDKPLKSRWLALELIHYYDSMELIQQTRIQKFARTIYESEQNNHENELLRLTKKAKEEDLLFANIYIGSILLGVMILILCIIYYYRMQKIKQENYLQSQIRETEKQISEKVKKKISEGLKNTITYIQSNMEDSSLKNKNHLVERLEKVYQLSRNISRENSFFQSSQEYPKELHLLIYSYQSDNLSIEIEDYFPKIWKKVSLNHRIEIYKAMNELMNILKTNSDATWIKWNFEIKTKELLLTSQDDGKKLGENLEESLNKFNRVKTRIQKLKGELQIARNSYSGLELQIKIPLKQSIKK
jgi:tetratricopeptide (TPR) repeat protein